MCSTDTSDPFVAFADELVQAGLLIRTGVKGVVARSGVFEEVLLQFGHGLSRVARPLGPEVLRFPPIFNRAHYCRINHIHNFPDLMGSVHVFTGGEREHREMLRKFDDAEDWTRDLQAGETMLLPAACYPLYPTATGTLGRAGRMVDLESYVFRHEPSDDPARLQIFRMREFVRMGDPDQALAHRDQWLERGQALLREIGLPAEIVVANDPFFGRGGRLSKATQREQALKFELVVPICSTEKPTAVSSSNYHMDYFGHAFDIFSADGQHAHTSCIGFGLERVTLALFKTHGLDPRTWPASVRAWLALG